MTDRELMQMAYQATPHEVLIAEIMDCGVPKNEREHAAAHEIQALRDRLAQPEYDQTALELCNVCGWKAVVPDECCLNCKRIAQPEPKPVAWLSKCYSDDNEDLGYTLWDKDVGESCFPVYSAPREWVGLTDEEGAEIWGDAHDIDRYRLVTPKEIVERISDKLREKNK
jgi:hypothetical protein